MSTLVAGPWAGEFGWELMQWQGYIRRKARKHEKTWVVTRRSSFDLYADFADELIEFNPPPPPKYRRDMWHGKFPLPKKPSGEFVHLPPFDTRAKVQEFIRYGKPRVELQKSEWVLLHARDLNRVKESTGRDWDQERWEKLYKMLEGQGIKMASIGLKHESHVVGDSCDYRDMRTRELFDLIASSRLTVGPSSGTMHLSQMCGTPIVVWAFPDSGKRIRKGTRLLDRYKKNWNPFNIPCDFIGDIMPSVSEVYGSTMRMLDARSNPA